MEMKAIQGREKRWARRGRLLSLFGCLLLQSNLHVLSSMPGKEKERDRRMGERPRKSVDRKGEIKRWARRGRQVQFLNVSPWSPVPSSMPGMIREREREGEGKKKRGQ